MQTLNGPLLKLGLLSRNLSTVFQVRSLVRAAKSSHALASSAKDVFSRPKLDSLASKSLDVYAHIAFRETAEYMVKPEPSFERWTDTVSNENDYIYKYIHKRLHDRFIDVASAAESLSISTQIERLRDICRQTSPQSERAKLHSTEIKKIFSEVKSQIEIMNQLELASVLISIKSESEYEFQVIKRMIDIELRWLLKKHVRTRLMDLDLWLYLSDIFYECKTRSTFSHVLLNYLTAEPDVNMSNKQLLHMLFLVILKRQQDGLLHKYESRINSLVSKASLEDVSIICMAYFKTRTPISNHTLLRRIIERTTELVPTIDPSTAGYGSIIKSIRYSRHNDLRESVINLSDVLLIENNRFLIFASPYNAVQTIKLLEAYRIYHPHLLDLFWKYLVSDVDSLRIKDTQYALTSLSNFAYKDLDLNCQDIADLNKLVKSAITGNCGNLKDYRIYHVLPLVRALATFGHYDPELTKYTSECLNDHETYHKTKDVLELDKSALLCYTANHLESKKGAKMEFKLETLYRISDKIDRFMSDVGSARLGTLGHLNSILQSPTHKKRYQFSAAFRDLAHSLAERDDFKDPRYEFNFQYTMAHQNYTDLVVSYGAKNPGCFNRGTLLPTPVPAGERHIIIFVTHPTDYVDGYDRLCGYKQFMIRLLTKLGYKVLITNLNDPDIDELSRRIKEVLFKRESAR